MANGLDVFIAYQTVTDWNAVRAAGYEFCFVKAGDGVTTRQTDGYGPKGRAAGVAMGAYWYAQPGDPVQQANMLCDRALSEGLTDLAPALDLESPFVAGAAATAFAIAFLRQVSARGFRPALYANNSMMSTMLAAVKAAVPNVIVWVAGYGANPTVGYDVWQWSDAGHVPGITASAVDLNKGAIPYNLAPAPANTSTRAPSGNSKSREELHMELKPGDHQHTPVPAAGLPPYLYISAGYGDYVDVHSLVFIGPTLPGGKPNYLPGGFEEAKNGGKPWRFNSDQPGPVRIPDGTAVVMVHHTTHCTNGSAVAWVS